ncbi:Phenylalanyl-tRNA synthetase [Mycena kentingensis (nom. inval.)]|nr:Phenylalanyl-tRNA synthetase [Mycena kentingensis (nom. inval.)]
MAQPSSTHHERTERDRDRDRDRERHHRSERSSHHHHRTISSTTLLLVLSLVLAGLAVMLSLPRQYSAAAAAEPVESNQAGVWGYLSPKRTQALIARESAVAVREAEVARREAELLIGAPGGVIPTPSPVLCPPCAATTVVEVPPAQTIIKEIVKEDSLTPPGWATAREDVLDRELRVSERERDITKREESVNRREHDASRRESWIMEQLIALGNDHPEVEEEYIYEPKRKAKALPFEPETKTVVQTQTVTVPAPANTRRASPPTPQVGDPSSFTDSPRTTAVEFIREDDDLKTVVVRSPKPTRRPRAWFGGW